MRISSLVFATNFRSCSFHNFFGLRLILLFGKIVPLVCFWKGLLHYLEYWNHYHLTNKYNKSEHLMLGIKLIYKDIFQYLRENF
jgi:hypothetical protein